MTLLVAIFAWMQFAKVTTQQAGSNSNAVGVLQQALNAVPCIPKLKEPLTVLVMGVDWNGEDAERYVGNRSDTMMLVHFQPDGNRINITSIPRDSRVRVARGHGVNKINYAHAIGGAKLAVETVENNFDVHIDNHVVVDTAGLRRIFDLLGPVEVVVEKEMRYEDHTSGLSIDLKPGKQLLNAQQLEGYVRFRKDATADLGRMERQQWFLRQAQQKLRDPAILLKAPELLSTAYDSISTDLPIDKVAEILSFAKDLDGGKIVTATLPGDAATVDGINYFFVNEDGARRIFSAMRHETEERGSLQEPIIAGDMPAEYLASHRKRFGKKHRRLSEDQGPIDKERVRISIKYPRHAEAYAQSTANRLRDQGWQIRHLIGTDEEDCLHAQVDLHTSRASTNILSLLRTDLPTMSKWPLVLKYGAYGSDLTLVLPSRGGMSIWQREARALMNRSDSSLSERAPAQEERASAGVRTSVRKERTSAREEGFAAMEERSGTLEGSRHERLAARKRKQRDEIASTDAYSADRPSTKSSRVSQEVSTEASSKGNSEEESGAKADISSQGPNTAPQNHHLDPTEKTTTTVRLTDEGRSREPATASQATTSQVPLAADPVASVPN